MKISISDIQINFLGCKITVSFPFLTIITLLLLIDDSGFVIYGLLAAIIHECGHMLAMLIKKCEPREITLRAFDINIIDKSRIKRSYNDDLFILIAGPLFNIIFSFVLFFVYRFYVFNFLIKLIFFNLFIGIFNILPIESLDGGQIFFNLLCRKLSIKISEKFIILTSFMILMPIAVFGFYILIKSKYNFSLLLLSCYLMGILLLNHKDFYY